MEEKEQNENKQVTPQVVDGEGCLKGCLSLIALFGLLFILLTSCGDSSPSYQPGDFDYDGDSGDFDDAKEFLEWKMKQEE